MLREPWGNEPGFVARMTHSQEVDRHLWGKN
jgi:hypothetical protein